MPFSAKYNSQCPLCDKQVVKGQTVIFAELQTGQPRKVVHSACYYGWKGSSAASTWKAQPGEAGSSAATQPADVPDNASDAAGGEQPDNNNNDANAQPSGNADAQDQQNQDDVIQRLARAIQPHLDNAAPTPTVDEAAVRAIAQQAAAEAVEKATAPLRVEVVQPNMPDVDCGLSHFRLPELLAAIVAGENVWIAGPAGTGKTHAAEQVAKALGKPFYYCGAISEPYSLLGFADANGRVVRTAFREAYEHGGVFLWDEVDASSPNALLAFSGALANGHCPFPDGMVARHPECRVIAAANTYGHGATSDYVGRCKIDAATLDRFTQLDWPLDTKLEAALCPNPEWLKEVRQARKTVDANGIKVLITPRASIRGAKLLAAGLPKDRVREMVLRRGMSDDQWAVVQETL